MHCTTSTNSLVQPRTALSEAVRCELEEECPSLEHDLFGKVLIFLLRDAATALCADEFSLAEKKNYLNIKFHVISCNFIEFFEARGGE